MADEIVLDCRDIHVHFGAVRAVNGFSFGFRRGRIHSVIGPNGAGKTTLMNALSGRVGMAGGQVLLHGRDIGRLRADQRTLAGLGRSFQVTQLFPGFSVRDNLRLAGLAGRREGGVFWSRVGRRRAALARADEVLEQIGLRAQAHSLADELSHGDQRALELGLALVSDPPVLLLDEPLAGIGHHNLNDAMALLTRVVVGRTVLLIEHNMDVVMGVSDEIVVMTQGRMLASGTPADIKANPAVRAAYLGDEA
ncbi:MAG: ABC transporter ATP-binding protein [Rubrivivax sp.]|nr:ABC transporter ATP-binding protein [Rubrivivax sp.]